MMTTDVKGIAPDMLQFVSRRVPRRSPGNECCLDHLHWMMLKIIDGKVVDDTAHRWQGFIQGVLVAQKRTTVSYLRKINSREEI